MSLYNKPWTIHEVRLITVWRECGVKRKNMAKILGRTESAIDNAIRRYIIQKVDQ